MTSEDPPQFALDPTFYDLEDDELDFFKAQTGINDEAELREHILEVQAQAYAIYPYPCIRRFAFTTMKISKYPSYENVLKIGRERPGAILLDLGCCFGNDSRKAVADGYPLENVIASDLHPEFWELGHKSFKSSPETFPAAFLPGDIFDPDFLCPIASPVPPPSSPIPPLSTLTSLTPLQHRVSVIHVSAFFHLFPLAQQTELARLIGMLLSSLPGSIIFGSHIGEPDTEETKEGTRVGHSPTSWTKMWTGEGGVFKPDDVVLWTTVNQVERKDVVQSGEYLTRKAYLHTWSVTRA